MTRKHRGNLSPLYNCPPLIGGRVSKETTGRWPPSSLDSSRCAEGCRGGGRYPAIFISPIKAEETPAEASVDIWDSPHINKLLTGLIYQGFRKTSKNSPLPRRQINCWEFKFVFFGRRINVLQRSLCCCCVLWNMLRGEVRTPACLLWFAPPSTNCFPPRVTAQQRCCRNRSFRLPLNPFLPFCAQNLKNGLNNETVSGVARHRILSITASS